MHMFVGVVAVSLVVASCGGADGTESNSTPTTAVAPGDTLGEPGSPSVEACGLSDPWGMVETAFVGTVAAVTTRDRISQEAIDGRAASGGEWPWVSFEVDGWYTKDFGTDFSMWAPGFAGRVGERWQIAGALYFVDGEQSGEVFPCVSTAATTDDLAAWDARYGGSVAARNGTPEQPADPQLVANIDAHEQTWEQRRPNSYTAIISASSGSIRSDECGASGQIRVVVEAGRVVEAVDLQRRCRVDDPTQTPTVDDLFDLARGAAGAVQGDVIFDQDLGFITGFSASDRSVDVWGGADLLADVAVPVTLGTDESLAAAEQARSRWEDSAIDSYTLDLEVQCFCSVGGRFEVTVTDGVIESVTGASGRGAPPDVDSFDFTVPGLLDSLTGWSGSTPDFIAAGFDELGYPVDIHIDAITEAVDDELTVLVRSLTPTS